MDFSCLKEFMDRVTAWRIPGNSVVVYKDNKKVFAYSSGYSSVENKVKMTGDELFYIYSCSKVATVTAALQLYERGFFLLTDPLYEYIPEFKSMYIMSGNGSVKKAENPITIQNLFTMTAGLSYNLESNEIKKAREITSGRMDTLSVIKYIAKMPLSFEPGEKWQYSLCHDVLAALVEIISGQKFHNYVKEHIFDPLEMGSSRYHINDKDKDKMAEQYQFIDDSESDPVKLQSMGISEKGTLENVGKVNQYILGDEYDSGGAGIITTVGDYAKFVAALSNCGLGLNGERILSKGTLDLLKTNQLNRNQLNCIKWKHLNGYGYGLGVRTMMDMALSGSTGSVGEFGWGGAAGATVLADTEENLAVFYAHHMLNSAEAYYQPRLRNVVYTCIK